MGLLCQPSGKAALDFVRKYICPLPAPSSTRKKYVHMHGLLGTFRPAYQYLSVKLPQMDEYYRICSVVFDEMKITKTCQIDKLVDMVVGPGSQVSNYLTTLLKMGVASEPHPPSLN